MAFDLLIHNVDILENERERDKSHIISRTRINIYGKTYKGLFVESYSRKIFQVGSQ